MKIYAVRNKEGKYFRAIGYGRSGINWVDTIEKAKLYSKIGQAKSRVTFFAKNYSKFGTPDLLEFDLGEPTVLDMNKYVQQAISKIEKKALKLKERRAQYEIDRLKRQQDEIQEKLKQYEGK